MRSLNLLAIVCCIYSVSAAADLSKFKECAKHQETLLILQGKQLCEDYKRYVRNLCETKCPTTKTKLENIITTACNNMETKSKTCVSQINAVNDDIVDCVVDVLNTVVNDAAKQFAKKIKEDNVPKEETKQLNELMDLALYTLPLARNVLDSNVQQCMD